MTQEGIDQVMEVFARHYLRDAAADGAALPSARSAPAQDLPGFGDLVAMQGIVCDEEEIAR